MHPIEDVIDVKNVLVESWDDVLNTADEIEKLINDGLLWLEDETNLAKAKAALQTDIPDFSFEDPFPQYLVEQVLDLVKTKLEADIPETESAEAIFKLLIKKIPILPNVDLPGLSLSTLKSVLDRVVEEGFSISLEDLPARNEESTVRLSNRSRSKDEQDSLQILQSGNTGLFYDLLNELTTQFEAVWSAHGKDLESIMKDLDGFISQNDMNSLENSLKPIINQLKSGAISPEQLIEQLPIVLKQEGETALKGVRSAQPILAEAIGPLRSMLDDLFTGPFPTESEVCSLYQMITKGDKAPSVLSLIALSVAIPLTLTNRAANDSSFTFDSSLTLATSAAEISAQNKLVIYGCVQLVNGIAYVLDALPEVRNRWQDREPRLLIVSCLADVLFCLMGVISQLVSKPSTAEAQFKGMSLNKGLWNLQWGTRVGLDGLSGVVKGVSAIRINQAQTKLERAEYDPVTNKQLQAKLDNVKAYFDVFKDENSVLLDVADTLLKLQEGMYELNNIIELDVETFNLQWAQKINEMKRDISSLFLHKELINEGNNKFEVEYFLDRVVPPHTLPLTLISSFRPNGKIREYCNGVMQLKSSVPTLSANSPNDIVETVKLVQKIEILDQNTLRAERRSVNDYLDTVDHDVKDVLDSLKKNITDQRYCTEVKALAPRIINELLALSSAFDDTIRELKVRQKTLQGVIGKVRTGQYQQIAQKLHVLRARCDELSQASSEAESAAREELKVQIANKDYWLKRIYILVLVSEIVHIVWSIVNYHAAGKDGDKETMANNVLDISPGLVDALIYLGIDAFLPPEQEADRKWTIGFTVFAFLDQLAYFALTLAIAFKK